MSAWDVSIMRELIDTNPIVIRNDIERLYGYQYYFPLYITVIPMDWTMPEFGFGLVFTRQPFLFTEPTYTWNYLGPLFLYCLGDRNLQFRAVILVTFVIVLSFSYSLWGIIVLLVIAVGAVVQKVFRLSMLGVVIFMAITVLTVSYVGIEEILSAIGGNLAGQFRYFTNIGALDITAWGSLIGEQADEVNDLQVRYGFLEFLNRYGIVGTALYVVSLLVIVFSASRIFSKSYRAGSSAFYTGLALIGTAALVVKTPNYISVLQILLFATYLKLLGKRSLNTVVPQST